MSKIEFILSIITSVCTGIMLVNVFVTPSVIRQFAIVIFSFMFLMTIVLVRLTFKEMVKELKKH